MHHLNPPSFAALEVYSRCISTYRVGDLKNRLTAHSASIPDIEANLIDKFNRKEYHLVSKWCDVESDYSIEGNELVYLYDTKFAAIKGPARSYYLRIKQTAIRGLCPYCKINLVSQVDHYLPKSVFQHLSIIPLNLFPICSDCNKVKLAHTPSCYKDSFIQPYFDEINDKKWLNANVIIVDNYPVVEFEVDPALCRTSDLFQRVSLQFNKLNLNNLYSAQAVTKLLSLEQVIRDLRNGSGLTCLRNYLIDHAKSAEMPDYNSWESAFLYALAKNDAYCEGHYILY